MQKFTTHITRIKVFWRAYFSTNKAQYLDMKIATPTVTSWLEYLHKTSLIHCTEKNKKITAELHKGV